MTSARILCAFLMSVSFVRTAGSQGTNGIARNPIVSSITGTMAEPEIFRDVNLTSFDLLTGSFQLKEDDQSVKVVFVPFKLRERYTPLISELAINLAQKKDVTTLGLGIAYNSKTGFSKKAQDDLKALLSNMKPFRSERAGEADAEFDLLRNAYIKKQWIDIYDRFYKDLAKNAWILSFAVNTQTFGSLGGDRIDVNEDGLTDNFYKSKGNELNSSFTYTASQRFGLTVAGHFARRRQSSIEGAKLASYPGWSIAAAARVRTLDPKYRESDNYLKSLFIPAIVVGLSLESETCSGSADTCEEMTKVSRAITPFAQIKISPETQFTIGVPIQRKAVFGGKTKQELAASLQYALQLKGTK